MLLKFFFAVTGSKAINLLSRSRRGNSPVHASTFSYHRLSMMKWLGSELFLPLFSLMLPGRIRTLELFGLLHRRIIFYKGLRQWCLALGVFAMKGSQSFSDDWFVLPEDRLVLVIQQHQVIVGEDCWEDQIKITITWVCWWVTFVAQRQQNPSET